MISLFDHGSLRAERQIQTIGTMITKHVTGKGETWSLYTSITAYAMNILTSLALSHFSPFELVFVCKPQYLCNLALPPLE